MSNHTNENCPQRKLENIAFFGGTFAVSQVGAFIGDTIHNPHIMDVPQGGALGISIVVASIGAVVADHLIHRSNQSE
jgi:uncharacterized membrane protein YeaQ/YmgE (transglycosylase-associated protein family)